jgi:hypothetical protein
MFTASMAGNYHIAAINALVQSIAFMPVIDRFFATETLAKIG